MDCLTVNSPSQPGGTLFEGLADIYIYIYIRSHFGSRLILSWFGPRSWFGTHLCGVTADLVRAVGAGFGAWHIAAIFAQGNIAVAAVLPPGLSSYAEQVVEV